MVLQVKGSPAYSGFCDASTVAYGTVAYIRNGTDSIQFVASKTRVSLLHKQNIPRLELLSCLLLARLITHVLEVLQTIIEVSVSQCFTDSMVALCWIKGEDKERKQFVHNRVQETRCLVPVSHWLHCPGKENPADMASRGISPQELEESLLWRHGPDWLCSIVLDTKHVEITMSEECITETKVKSCEPSCNMLITTDNGGIGKVIDYKRFSTLQKLLKVTVYVKKFVQYFKATIKRHNPVVDWTVTVDDIEKAELHWIADCQKY